MGDLTFTSSLCLAFLSFSHGRTWLRAGDRAPRGSRKTETARPFRSARSLRAGRTHPGNRQDDRTRQDRSALPKCRPSANVRNAAMPTWPSFWLRRPKIRALAAMAGRSPVRAVAPVAWLDSYGRRRHVGPWSQEFSPAGFPRKRGPRPAFLAHAPAAPKFVAPAGAQRCACPPLASGGSGSVSSSRP